MADLDLKELDRLEKKALLSKLGFSPALLGLTVDELDNLSHQLWPLLDLVEKMGEALRKCGRHTLTCPYPKAKGLCDCGLAVLADYRRAKGEL